MRFLSVGVAVIYHSGCSWRTNNPNNLKKIMRMCLTPERVKVLRVTAPPPVVAAGDRRRGPRINCQKIVPRIERWTKPSKVGFVASSIMHLMRPTVTVWSLNAVRIAAFFSQEWKRSNRVKLKYSHSSAEKVRLS